MVARLDRSVDVAGTQARQIPEQALEFRDHAPVVPRAGDEHQEMVRRIIPSLQVVPAPNRLNVADPHLELDRRALSTADEHRIPRPLIRPAVAPRKPDFDRISQRRPDMAEEAHEPACLRGVPHRRTSRVQADGELEPEHGCDSIELDDRRGELRTFDSAVPEPGDASRCGDMRLAEAEGQPLPR